MEIFLVLLGLLGSIAFVTTIWYLIRWIIGKAGRKPIFRKRFFISIIVFMFGVVGLGILGSQQNDKEATRLGFASTQEYLDAKKEDISDPAKWAELIAQREAEENQRIADQEAEAARVKQEAEDQVKAEAEAKAEQERQAAEELAAKEKAEEEACRKEIKCWGEKAHTVATFSCPRLVERFAKYDFEWTDGWTEPKFSHFRWRDIGAGTVTVIGDKIKMQNGFGAWSHMKYGCDIDVVKKEVLDVRVSEGRI